MLKRLSGSLYFDHYHDHYYYYYHYYYYFYYYYSIPFIFFFVAPLLNFCGLTKAKELSIFK